jgi:hypothetical protein
MKNLTYIPKEKQKENEELQKNINFAVKIVILRSYKSVSNDNLMSC